MIRGLAIAAFLSLGLAVAFGGAAPFGRLLMGAGLPGPAAALLGDPAWKGAALYRAARFDAAARAFAQARDDYNLGLALVQAGDHAAALEAWDRARLRGDAQAAANFDVLAGWYAGLAVDPDAPVSWAARKSGDGPTADAPEGQGKGRAAGQGDEATNAGANLGLPELESRGRLGVRRIFDDTYMVANERWIATLPDVPGAYLDARIALERKRRADLGLAPPEPEDPR